MLLDSLKEETNYTTTENGAVTHISSLDACVDLFGTIGALRYAPPSEVVSRFQKALLENPLNALRIAFYSRDVRGGLGERKVFRTILKWLGNNYPEYIIRNIHLVAEYGRYDDLMELFGTKCEENVIGYVKSVLTTDLENMVKGEPVSLLAKWLPSTNASNRQTRFMGKKLAKGLGLKEPEYRRILVSLRKHIDLLENKLRTCSYDFDYSKQPSKAMFKYRKAFIRNDGVRYSEFMHKVDKGEVELKTKTLYPYEVIRPLLHNPSSADVEVINTTWNALPNYVQKDENSMVVLDGSGSMYWGFEPYPIDVAMSLAIYMAERNKGKFANHFISFGSRPQVIEIKGETIDEKVNYCRQFDDCGNTDLSAVFDVLLKSAVKNNIPAEEMPTTLYIISDMEFDAALSCPRKTVFQDAKANFEEAGYKLPNIVFWNVYSRNVQQPVTINDRGAVLVSGCSPTLFKMVITDDLNPYQFMLTVIESERYAPISI